MRDLRLSLRAREILTYSITKPSLQSVLREIKMFRFTDIEMSFNSVLRDSWPCKKLTLRDSFARTIKNETVRPVKFDENFAGTHCFLTASWEEPLFKNPWVKKDYLPSP